MAGSISAEQSTAVKQNHFRRTGCRLCNHPHLDLVLQLTPTPPVDAFVPKQRLGTAQESFPLDLFLCRDCGHAQLLDVVDPDILFGNYIYETSSSPGLVDHFRSYANGVFKFVQPSQNSLVIDIGSNDGTLLQFFKDKGLKVLGIDPAKDIAAAATSRGLPTLPQFFGSKVGKEVRSNHGPASLVCANNVFAHSDTLDDMADGVRQLLGPNGVFVFEVSYMLDMIENMVFDFIYHEHLCHHAVKPLQRFLSAHGMELIFVEKVPTKGGSIRVFAQLAGASRPVSPVVEEMIQREIRYGLYSLECYRKYAAKVESIRRQNIDLYRKLAAQGKTLAAYGASATTTVLTYHFDLGNSLKFIVDDNEHRQGLYSPGYHIPVVSSKAIYEQRPDYVILLAWRFADMIIQKHQKYLDLGGCFITPLPELKMTHKKQL